MDKNQSQIQNTESNKIIKWNLCTKESLKDSQQIYQMRLCEESGGIPLFNFKIFKNISMNILPRIL